MMTSQLEEEFSLVRLAQEADKSEHMRTNPEANEQVEKTELPAGLAGTISLGGQLEVRRLGFGAMRITGDGIWGAPKDPDTALRVLRRAVELGANFIDTADSYGPYVSEELIAKAL